MNNNNGDDNNNDQKYVCRKNKTYRTIALYLTIIQIITTKYSLEIDFSSVASNKET